MNTTFDIQLSRPDDFNSLVLQIQHATEVLQENARMVINRDVTARAWLRTLLMLPPMVGI